MKITVEITLKKVDGKSCDEEEVFQVVEEALDGETLYPQNAEADEESSYEVTSVIYKPKP